MIFFCLYSDTYDVTIIYEYSAGIAEHQKRHSKKGVINSFSHSSASTAIEHQKHLLGTTGSPLHVGTLGAVVFFLGCCLQLTNHGASRFSRNSLTSLRVLTARVIIIANFKFIVLMLQMYLSYCGPFEGFDFPFSGKVQPGPLAGSAHQAAKLHTSCMGGSQRWRCSKK